MDVLIAVVVLGGMLVCLAMLANGLQDGMMRSDDGRRFFFIYDDPRHPERPTHMKFEDGEERPI